jgi:hypothetical protein
MMGSNSRWLVGTLLVLVLLATGAFAWIGDTDPARADDRDSPIFQQTLDKALADMPKAEFPEQDVGPVSGEIVLTSTSNEHGAPQAAVPITTAITCGHPTFFRCPPPTTAVTCGQPTFFRCPPPTTAVTCGQPTFFGCPPPTTAVTCGQPTFFRCPPPTTAVNCGKPTFFTCVPIPLNP